MTKVNEKTLAKVCSDAAPAEAAEPVAWMYSKNGNTLINQHDQPWKSEQGWAITPLYASPPAPAGKA